MSKATFTFGRFNPPTEEGHGKLVSAVQKHAEETGGKHYIFPSHTQDKKKNPLSHEDKVGAMHKLFPKANVVSHEKVRTAIDAMKHLESKGHTHVTMVVGSDRQKEFHGLLNKYRKKEFPGIKKVNVVSAGHRDPDAEGAEGMSASKLRGLVSSGKKKEFMSHYSDKKLAAHLHDKIKQGMQMESVNPVGIFLLGGPGSGKDYVLKNIFSRFDLTEVQIDQLLTGRANELTEQRKSIVINSGADLEKIELVKAMLEGYDFDHVYVSVTNKVSRMRNEEREQPLLENKRLQKWFYAEKIVEQIDDVFVFNNSINLLESTEMEKILFGGQIEKLLERIVNHGLTIQEEAEPKTFTILREKKFPSVAKDKESGLPKKYVRGLSPSTAKARAAHWKEKAKLSDSDPRAYEPAPGDATAKTKPSKYTKKFHDMYGEAANPAQQAAIAIAMKKAGKKPKNEEVEQIDERNVENKKKKDEYVRLQGLKAMKAGNVDPARGHSPTRFGREELKKEEVETVDEVKKPDASVAMTNQLRMNAISDKDKRTLGKVASLMASQRKVSNPPKTGRVAEETIDEGAADTSLAAKAKKSGISVGTLRKVYKRGVAAWNSGHRPGTTPQQWGHARVNSYITKGKTYHTADKDLREEIEDINTLFEMQFDGCPDCPTVAEDTVDVTPDLTVKKPKKKMTPGDMRKSELDGLPVASYLNHESKQMKFMPNAPQLRAQTPPGTKTVDGVPQHNVPKGYKRVKDYRGGFTLKKEETAPELTLEEAVKYHLDNNISITENVFRPGSDMFFELISEAKRLYSEGKYTPADEYEKDLLNSDIGEIAEYEGQLVVLDFPIEETIEEACWKGYVQKGMKKKGDKMVPNCVNEEEGSDPTGGKGIGKPFRSGGGGAVYVRTGDGGVRKVNFSQSGMKKRYNEPGRVRSFVARHHCLTNKDKTSASYWACRWPRYFSDSGQTWW